MIKVDLITGFLGSGKTTFIKKYASYLVDSGVKIGIIENDFGAINVDMLLLQDLQSENCEVEQIVGGSVVSEWKRRFRTKLISMAMRGFERIIVEPSGIFDVDVFFDVLYDDTVQNWYEIGNVFTIVNGKLQDMSDTEQYLFMAQAAKAGKIIFSKLEEKTDFEEEKALTDLNVMMERFHCDRRFQSFDFLTKPWDSLTKSDFDELLLCGYKGADHPKMWIEQKEAFDCLFFMNQKFSKSKLEDGIKRIFEDEKCGMVQRIKGFAQVENGEWIQINVTKKEFVIEPVTVGQEVLIVIGENLKEEMIRSYLD